MSFMRKEVCIKLMLITSRKVITVIMTLAAMADAFLESGSSRLLGFRRKPSLNVFAPLLEVNAIASSTVFL